MFAAGWDIAMATMYLLLTWCYQQSCLQNGI